MKSKTSAGAPVRKTSVAEVVANLGLLTLSLINYQQLAAPACDGQLHTLPDDSPVLAAYPCDGQSAQRLLYLLRNAPRVLWDIFHLKRADVWCGRDTLAFLLRLVGAVSLRPDVYSQIVSPLIVYFVRADMIAYHLMLGPSHQPTALALRAIFVMFPAFDVGYFILLLGTWRVRPALELAHCAFMAVGLLVLWHWHGHRVPGGGVNIAWQVATRLAVPCITLYLSRRMELGQAAAGTAGPGGSRYRAAGGKGAADSKGDGAVTDGPGWGSAPRPAGAGKARSSARAAASSSSAVAGSSPRRLPFFFKTRTQPQTDKQRPGKLEQEQQQQGPGKRELAMAAPTPGPTTRHWQHEEEGAQATQLWQQAPQLRQEEREPPPPPQLPPPCRYHHQQQQQQAGVPELSEPALSHCPLGGIASSAAGAAGALSPGALVDGAGPAAADLRVPLLAPLLARRPRYRPFVRHHTISYKIPWAEPEQLTPGYEQRLGELVEGKGLQLTAVYVRRGCIELTLVLEEKRGRAGPAAAEQGPGGALHEAPPPPSSLPPQQLGVAAVVRALGLMPLLQAQAPPTAAAAAAGDDAAGSSCELVALRLAQIQVRSSCEVLVAVEEEEEGEITSTQLTRPSQPAGLWRSSPDGSGGGARGGGVGGGGGGSEVSALLESLLTPHPGLSTAG